MPFRGRKGRTYAHHKNNKESKCLGTLTRFCWTHSLNYGIKFVAAFDLTCQTLIVTIAGTLIAQNSVDPYNSYERDTLLLCG